MSRNDQLWFAVDIVVDPQCAEAVEHAFNMLDALGTETGFARPENAGPVTITGYFDAVPVGTVVSETVARALRGYEFDPAMVGEISYREVENRDWLAEWKKHWKPTEVGNFIISPPWESVGDTDKRVIYIEPNMAFGTGTHETTQLCLMALQNDLSPGESFLDVGTGTGILAIAAAKLNQRWDGAWLPNLEHCPEIAACDTDGQAVELARENALLNGVGENIQFFTGSAADAAGGYEFTCANLTLDVILPILPVLLAKTRRQLVLSGILTEQETAILAQLEKLGVPQTVVARAGEWISVSVLIETP